MTSQTATDPYGEAERAADHLRRATGIHNYETAVVLGSGWAAAAEDVGEVMVDVELSTVPGFPPPRVAGHRDLVRALRVGDRHVLLFGGRSHLYEGISTAEVVHGVRTAAALGCGNVVLTNAAGGLRTEWSVGQPVLISDHLNLTGHSPMMGAEPPPPLPGRFCDLTNAYSPRLRAIALEADPALPSGVYAGLIGGSYETPAEITMLATLGADLVGMSTVLETIAARHLGVEVLGISLVTNLAAGLSPGALSHGEVLTAATDARDRVIGLIRGVLEHPDLVS